MSRNSEPIQTQPLGLLGLLQLKNKGVNPDVLIGTVQPEVDMLGFWLRREAQNWPVLSEFSLSPGFYGSFFAFTTNPIVVPDNETWYVHDYRVTGAPATGSSVAGEIAVAWRSVGPLGPAFPQGIRSPGPQLQGYPPTAWASGFWVPPRGELGLHVQAIGAAGFTFQTSSLRFTRCQV